MRPTRPLHSTLILVLLLAGNAQSATVKIDLYTDVNRTSCELIDQGTELLTIYYFLSGDTPALAARFSAPKPDCWIGATWVGDISASGSSIGDTQQDWSVGFGSCKTFPTLVGQSSYYATGGGLPCCEVIAKDPGPLPNPGPAGGFIDRFVWVDCNFAELPLQVGQHVVVNADASCHCQQPLAIESTTWGWMKSLYR